MKKATRKQTRQEHFPVYEEVSDEMTGPLEAEDEHYEEWNDESDSYFEPTEKDIRQTNRSLQQRQQEFRRAAEVVARELASLLQVEKVVLFGSVAMPLQKEVPRFRQYRRERIAVWHECKDVDLAVWLSDLDHLKSLHRARTRALNELLATEDIGVAHHQVEMLLMEPSSDRYLGRLCTFAKCPKKGHRGCSVAGCGQKRFLAQHEDFVFHPESRVPERSVVLFDRNGGVVPKGENE